ncbi:riboflavin kinase isoform X2 [Musca autumnalis]|uniref:riboflavin kinase isoform X2 n=1 Tax=Musca autumnalis TaxID=221902 RepID=UPI003CFAA043
MCCDIGRRYFCTITTTSRNLFNTRCYSTLSLEKMLNNLPFFACGKIVSGFGRGSKDLGIPTANFPLDVVKSLPEAINPGVYYGWANVDDGPVYKMVMSIGWNPFYDNKEKSMETHILHKFDGDLYGSLLKVCIAGYLRPEENFKSLDDLIARIKQDIADAEELLETNETNRQLQYHDYFTTNSNCSLNNLRNGKN